VKEDRSSTNRRLAAILAADIAGYSRLMGEDEAATVRDLKAHQAVVLPLVGRYGGRIIDTAGDGILAEFPSVINATECAVEIQTIMATRNEAAPESRRMRFRIGINLGDVIHDETRIYGDGINVAARLEGIAEPGGICISRQVFDQVSRSIKADFQALGPRTLKNIAHPVDVFAIAPPPFVLRELWPPETGAPSQYHVPAAPKIPFWPMPRADGDRGRAPRAWPISHCRRAT